MSTLTATHNSLTGKNTITYADMPTTWYLCWSDSATSDYSALVDAAQYVTVNQSSGTWTDDNTPNYGTTRHYYAVDPYNTSLITSTSCTTAALTVIASDFVATAGGATSVGLSFTLPGTVSASARIYWQYTLTDPTSAGFSPSSWVTLGVTDVTGNTVS